MVLRCSGVDRGRGRWGGEGASATTAAIAAVVQARTCQHEHGGGFSGSVVTEKRRDFAFVHVQIQLVDGRSRLARKYLYNQTRRDTIRRDTTQPHQSDSTRSIACMGTAPININSEQE